MGTLRTWALLLALFLITPSLADEPRVDRYGDPLPPGAVARLGTIRFRHGHPHSPSAEFLPDGKTIVTGTSDGKLRFWDAATGKLVQTETVLEGVLVTMALAPDGKRLAVAGFQGAATWDLEHRRPLHALKAGRVSAVAFSPDGRTLVTGGDDHDAMLRVYDAVTGKERRRMKWHDRKIDHVRIAPDNRTLISVSSVGRMAHVCDLESGEELHVIKDRSWMDLYAAELLPDGKTLVLAGGRQGKYDGKVLHIDGMVELYDVTTGKQVRALKTDIRVSRARLLLGGKELIAQDYDGTVRRWDAATWEPLPPPPAGWLHRISADGRTGLRVYGLGVALYDRATGKPLHDFDGHLGNLSGLAFSPDGTRIASHTNSGNDIRIWHVAAGKTERTLAGHPGRQVHVFAVLTAPGGFLSSATDGTLRLWDAATGAEVRQFRLEGQQHVWGLAVSADGQRLLCAHRDFGGHPIQDKTFTITTFDLATGKPLASRQETATSPLVFFPPSLSPDGRTLLKSAGKALALVDVDSGKELCQLTAPDVFDRPFVFAPDGRSLATRTSTQKSEGLRHWRDDFMVRVFDTSTGKERFAVANKGWGHPLAFSGDSRLLAAGTEQAVVLLDAATGQERWRSPDVDQRVAALAFAPDGKTLASGHGDGTILIWDIARVAR